MIPAAKEILFSTGILFIHFFILSGFFPKAVFFLWDFQILSNSKTFPWLFYRSSISLIFVCTSSKLSKASFTFNSNITTTYALPPYLSGGNIKWGIISALNARTYNAEVQSWDAQIHNNFVYLNTNVFDPICQFCHTHTYPYSKLKYSISSLAACIATSIYSW